MTASGRTRPFDFAYFWVPESPLSGKADVSNGCCWSSGDQWKRLNLNLNIIRQSRPRYQENRKPGHVPGFLCPPFRDSVSTTPEPDPFWDGRSRV